MFLKILPFCLKVHSETLSKIFGETCKHTEVALNFIYKQYFSFS